MSLNGTDGRPRAKHVRALLDEVLPLVEAGLAAGLPRGAPLDFPALPALNATPEARALAAALYKRGGATGPGKHASAAKLPFPPPIQASLCAPCFEPGEAALLAHFKKLATTRHTLFVVDAGMAARHPAWRTACELNAHVWLNDAEGSKTPAGLRDLLIRAEEVNSPFHRILAVGGGATSDLAGLLAGLLGMAFEVVPTTFLAAVDAAQGGKTGINMPPYGKNQLGLFHGAEAFHLVPEVFKTLCAAERASGFGEALKHCFLFGRWPLASHEACLAALTMEPSFLRWNMDAKSRVVNADPSEAHVRKLLNLGHTLGHAWEGLQENGLVSVLPHGVCVAFGLRTLANAGLLVGAPHSFLSAVNELVEGFSPRPLVPLSELEPAFLRLVAADKKNGREGEVVLVTPRWGVLSGEASLLKSTSFLEERSLSEAFLTRKTPEACWELFTAHGGFSLHGGPLP